MAQTRWLEMSRLTAEAPTFRYLTRIELADVLVMWKLKTEVRGGETDREVEREHSVNVARERGAEYDV